MRSPRLMNCRFSDMDFLQMTRMGTDLFRRPFGADLPPLDSAFCSISAMINVQRSRKDLNGTFFGQIKHR